jgi:proline iminopeptidase
MRVVVNGSSIWFDVEGAGLVPDGRRIRRRPTLVLLHGGPDFDHSYFNGVLTKSGPADSVGV